MAQWQQINQAISEKLGEDFSAHSQRPVGGGCINDAYVISNGASRFFVKLNAAGMESMFAAEAAGLQEILASKSVYAPAPVCWGTTGSQSYIVMEALDLNGSAGSANSRLGQQLALMHKQSAPGFGWKMDNTIGSTPQPNANNPDWLNFFARSRLGFQLALAEKKGCDRNLVSKGAELIETMGAFFSDYQPRPALLHGDLWSGNYGVLASGQPVIFDPAVYFGDREADIAMTELFGGFGRGFFDAYNEAWPLDAGYPVRKTLYNLYHILNHYNMFGGGYQAQALGMVERLLSETS
jgi:protein-ribulosamine 3-kinase